MSQTKNKFSDKQKVILSKIREELKAILLVINE